jgi:hypothetical protein
MMTKTHKVLEAFHNGEELTAAQITARFGAANPARVVHSLREKGHCIYLNKRTNSKGTVTHKYRLGKPTRQVIAAGIASLGAKAAGLV